MITYVCGHRNPDTDTIVASIAYAALNNMLGENEYVPVRLGHINDETTFLLDRFGFQPPAMISSVRTQIRDVEFDNPPRLSASVPVSYAWNMLLETPTLNVLPIINEDETLYGLVTGTTIAQHDMQTIQTPVLQNAPVLNVLSALEGSILNREDDMFESISGNVVIALPGSGDHLRDIGPAGRRAEFPYGRLPGRREGSDAAEQAPQLPDPGPPGPGSRHPEPVPSAAAKTEADRSGGP